MDMNGTPSFIWQRLTALANIPLALFFLFALLAHADADHAAVRAFLAQIPVAAALLAFIVSALFHAHIGMTVIIEDYVHHDALKPLALTANLLFCLGTGLACLLSAMRLFFSG